MNAWCPWRLRASARGTTPAAGAASPGRGPRRGDGSRKPGAFARYRFREELFPRLVFRQAYDALRRGAGERADAEYVKILHPAASTRESEVAAALATILAGHERFDYAAVKQLVQELLAAKREAKLPRLLRKLDGFALLIVDDIAYVKQSLEEAEVLFTLIAERYESRSLLITSNLVFSEWERIFKEPMATAAAIDRVVHHSVILEFDVSSYRSDEAATRAQATAKTPGRRRAG